jgi:hypothetical protein
LALSSRNISSTEEENMKALFAPAKRTRFLIALGLALLLATPAVMIWANKVQLKSSTTADLSDFEAYMAERTTQAVMGIQLPKGFPSAPEFAPFGGPIQQEVLSGDAARGKLLTNLGHADWDAEKDTLLGKVPPALRADKGTVEKGQKGSLKSGLNYVQLSAEAINARGIDAVLASISSQGRVAGFLPDRTLLLYVDAGQRAALRSNPDIERSRAYEPYNKIALDFGVRPQINRNEASNPDIRASLTIVPGLDSPELRDRIAALPGVSELNANEFDNGYTLRINYKHLAKVARVPEVLHIAPVYEHMLSNSESPWTVQMGSAEDSLGIQPFTEAGVDGGGIADNGVCDTGLGECTAPVTEIGKSCSTDSDCDGPRVNNGQPAVPPQIVSVIDNGVSIDSPGFSQTATQPTTAFTLGLCDTNTGLCTAGQVGEPCGNDFDCDVPAAPVGPSHRKLHGNIVITDTNQTCDAPLSGAGTHGNVVASAIAAAPSELGFFLTKAGIGASGEARNERMDGVAPGARILMSDAGTPADCNIDSLVERGGNVSPGDLGTALGQVRANAQSSQVHVAVLPFGAPDNFSTNTGLGSNGTYNDEAVDLDTFAWNNRDFLIVMPVGNNGALIGNNRLGLALNIFPDFFNGTNLDDVGAPVPIQTTAPATAKNILAVGGSTGECFTFFGSTTDCEGAITAYSSRGPATPASLRMAPKITAPNFDLLGGTPAPRAGTVAVFRSRDNDNASPVEAELDEGNFGTSFAAAYVSGLAAIVNDYFAQGFYPTGSRVDANRVSRVSSSLVLAAITASADFSEGGLSRLNEDTSEKFVRRTRCLDVGSPGGASVGIICNSEQGYGRAVGTNVLPLANWSDSFRLHPSGANIREYPAAGLLVWDSIATGEPGLNNTGNTSKSHTFLVSTPNAIDVNGGTPGGLVATESHLRVSLAWLDRPGTAGAGGLLINDLDLRLQSPGPDNLLDTGDDRFFKGNNYGPATDSALLDQWSIVGTGALPTNPHDPRNNTEAIHLTGDANGDAFQIPTGAATPEQAYGDSQIHIGTWRITALRGAGGATPGSLTIDAVNEDANGNGRLDAGEDTTAPIGLMNIASQPYSLVVAGPVFRDAADAAPLAGPGAAAYPAHSISLDSIRYDCSQDAVLTIQSAAGTCLAPVSQASTIFQVLDGDGNVVETETGFSFTQSGATCTSQGVPIRLGAAAINNGILEVDTGYTVRATYNNTVNAVLTASAPVNCNPDFINASFASASTFAFTQSQVTVGGGCDQDSHLDSGEVVTYGVALQNKSRTDDYADLNATLTASGGATGAVRVLDSPKNMGRLPGSGVTAAFFHVFVDPAQIPVNPNDRWVELTLNLDSLFKGVRISNDSYTFRHALDSDWESLHYSTDKPSGGREVRDLDRDLLITYPNTITETRERNFAPGPGFLIPDEDITFSSMWVVDPSTGEVNNTLGEDLNDNSALDAGEERIPNTILDRGVLASSGGATALDKIPWSLDRNAGGWVPFRHAMSNPGTNLLTSPPMWEYKSQRPICGFQTAADGTCVSNLCTAGRIGQACVVNDDCDSFGIWKTGDTDAATPSSVATACDTHAQPADPGSPAKNEFTVDVLMSPIIAQVNQGTDNRGFPYLVEFQRWGLNQNIQTLDGYAGGGFTIDNNVDSDNTVCLLCAQIDQYYTRRLGGFDKAVFRLAGQYFNGAGINPGVIVAPFARTFGPFRDRGTAGVIDPADSGFAGATNGVNFSTPGTCDTGVTNLCTSPPDRVGDPCTADADCDSGNIQEAGPDYLKYPLDNPVVGPPTPVPGTCDGGTEPGSPCQTNPDCDGGGTCTLAMNTTAGPNRNFDASMIEFEGGFSTPINNCDSASCPEFFFFWTPGPAADRWQLGISFWAIESPGGGTDYGYGFDDPVFEWDESHPQDEAVLGHTPACDRFNLAGEPGGGQCATLTVDRTAIFECDEAIEVTVYDAKCLSVGAGAITVVGGACTTDADCGTGGNCTADNASATVFFVTDTDSIPVATDQFIAAYPKLTKPFSIPAVPGEPGLYRGNVILSTTTNDQNHAFTVPGTDGVFTVYYFDPLCDGDRDGDEGEYDFTNVDGDGVADLSDVCPQEYNPVQEDDDGDGVGDVCDSCPFAESVPVDLTAGVCDTSTGVCMGGSLAGFPFCSLDSDCAPPWPGQFSDPGQVDTDADQVGDQCDFDDVDLDGVANGIDPCGDVFGTASLPAGEICGTVQTGVTCDTDLVGVCDTGLGQCTSPGQNAGEACTVDADCNAVSALCDPAAGCSKHVGICDVGGTDTCLFGPNAGAACVNDYDCSDTCAVNADCACDFDRDLDGVLDKDDNCVLTPNGSAQSAIGGVGNQSDSDGDGLGDACDGDCTDAVVVGKCRNVGVSSAGVPMFCGAFGFAYGFGPAGAGSTGACDPGIHADLPVADFDIARVCQVYTYHPQDGSSTCSTEDDDFDIDFVEDNTDTCPSLFNAIVVPGTKRQSDVDRDSLGDVCDPSGTFDDEFDGIPDDAVGFTGSISCRSLALASLTILSSEYQDLNGDIDPFPDTGETGRVRLTIQNAGGTLTDATIFLQTEDSDVECISEPAVLVGTIPAGAQVTVGSLVAGPPGFTFTASNSLLNLGPPNPVPTVRMNITVVANETLGISTPTFFTLLADLDAPPGVTQVFTAGPNGIYGDSDDGIISENFDVDKDKSGVFNVSDTWMVPVDAGQNGLGCPTDGDCTYHGNCSTEPSVSCDPTMATGVGTGNCELGVCTATVCTAPSQNAGNTCATNDDCTGTPVCYAGRYMRATLGTPGVNELAAVSCGGFDDPNINPVCDLDPDVPMNWHFHCPAGALNCPNTDTGTCVGGCSYATPTDVDGHHFTSTPNSMHVGAHFGPSTSQIGDSTHFRNVAAYVSAPMNMALFPRPGDLELRMKHLARLVDNNGVGGGANEFQCSDCGDVQIRIDTNDDKDIDSWGFWDKLVPFQSVYDKKGMAWSAFNTYYCLFTPTDTGTAPPNPRGVHETLCFPLGLWARCGSTVGTTTATTGDCGGVGIVEPDGKGVFLETKFNLAGFLGQRVEVRWVMESWVFDGVSSSYFEIGPGWNNTTADDGWWLDDIAIIGTVEEQVTPQADTRASSGGVCLDDALVATPGSGCDNSVDDGGTVVVLKVQDLDGNVIDGITSTVTAGQSVRISAIDSQITGGCVNGIAEFQFFKHGELVQDWGPKTFYLDAPEADVIEESVGGGAYQALVRCSTDFSCTSAVGAHIDVPVYSGEGGDSFFGELASPPNPSVGVQYNRLLGETTLKWWNPGNAASDVYRGIIDNGTKGTLAAPFYILNNSSTPAACLTPSGSNVVGTATTAGSNFTLGPMGLATDPNPPLGSAVYYLSTGNTRGGQNVNALGCANPSGLTLNLPPPFFGCPGPGDPNRIVRQPTSLCP